MNVEEDGGTGQRPQSEPRVAADTRTEASSVQAPAVRGRRALAAIRRALTDDELQNPGAQKLLLDALDRADTEIDALREYQDRFHEADKRAAVLGEKLSSSTSADITFGVGVGVGGALIGLTPYFSKLSGIAGWLCLALGLALAVGAAVARMKAR